MRLPKLHHRVLQLDSRSFLQTGEPEPRVEARGCSDVRDKDAVLVYGVSEGEEVLASGAGGKSEGGDGRSGSAAHEETKGGAAQDMSDSDKIAAAMEKNMPMHMQWLGLSEGESGTTPEDSDFASAGNAATKALEEVGQTCGGEGADKFGEDGFVGDGDRRRAHQTPLPDIYAVGLQVRGKVKLSMNYREENGLLTLTQLFCRKWILRWVRPCSPRLRRGAPRSGRT